jgi:predicted GIY-YIG superfamily endonuclease
MLRCADGSYYVGHTENLESRLASHEQGLISGYTQARRPVRLVWHEESPARAEAIEAEMRIKRWTRDKKEALAKGGWDAVHALRSSRRDVRRE